MEKVIRIFHVNLKYNALPNILACIFMMAAAPLFMGMENLMEYQVAKIVEVYLSLFGIILIIPVFAPELNKDIKDLIYSKKTPVVFLHIIRTLQSVLILAVFAALFLNILKHGNCKFHFDKMFYTVMANALFLGGTGMLIFAVSDQIVFAYMLPLVYYGINFGLGMDKLGKLYLFSMQSGVFGIKHWLMAVGVISIVFGLCFKEIIRHIS